MVAQKAIDPSLPGFSQLLQRLSTRIFRSIAPTATYDAALSALVARAYVDHLLTLAESATMPLVRAEARYELMSLLGTSLRSGTGTARPSAIREQLASDIRGWMAGTYKPAEKKMKLAVPPGSPIGDQ